MRLSLLDRDFNFFLDVKNHINLLEENGVDVSELRARYLQLRERIPREERADRPEWEVLERNVIAADTRVYPGEPDTLEEIRQARPKGRIDRYDTDLPDEVLADRIAGAWRGRIAGCILGKPVESFLSEEGHRANLRRWMSKAGDYPVTDWTTEEAIAPYWDHLAENVGKWMDKEAARKALRGNIEFVTEDDDLRYTVMNLRLLQAHGREFDRGQALAHRWHFLGVPAERAVRSTVGRNLALGLDWPEAARFMNTGREWLGPQIRADIFGYVSPGAPEAAAGMAFHEASTTTVQNGIYGALWIAACLAAALHEDNPETVVRRGMEQIPEHCRLAQALNATLEACRRNGDDWEATMDDIEARTGHYHCIHSIPNCCIIAMALVQGARDFGHTISIAVSVGWDTDCNGAHAGSIAGMMLGADALPTRWTEPFGDTLYSGVDRIDPLSIRALIDDTVQLAKR
jgi:ADP-ribosylglycohydrolase